jgi:hypothetical protein
MSSTDYILKKKVPSSSTSSSADGGVPLTFRLNEQTALVLTKMYLVELITKRSDPFLNHDSAIRTLLEEHYGKPFDQLVKEFQEKQKG